MEPNAVQLHESFDRTHTVAEGTDRGFGLVFAGVFALLAGHRLWHSHMDGYALLGIAALFATLALWRPRTLSPLNRAWARVGQAMHALVTPLLMGLIYFGVLLPIGLFMRAIGKDLLQLRRDASAQTYWKSCVDPGHHVGSMKDQF